MSIQAKLQRAADHLKSATPESLRYAALELRLCMEEITYTKLRNAKKHLPPSVLEKWQAPQAMRALIEFEPNADSSFKLFMSAGPVGSPGAETMVELGEHRSIGIRWLNRNYHKVGSLLHDPLTPGRLNLVEEDRTYLEGVLAHLGRVAEGNLLGLSMIDPYSFICQQCKDTIVVSKHRLKTAGEYSCLNPNCRAEYVARFSEEGVPEGALRTFDFKCTVCGVANPIEVRTVKAGFKFDCSACGAGHVVVAPGWHYGPLKGDAANP